MAIIRIALANVRNPVSPDDSLEIVTDAIRAAADQQAAIVCFPECIVPGYRLGTDNPPPENEWLESAWSQLDSVAAECRIGLILGTERPVENGWYLTARVTSPDGSFAGFQDKVQLDPTEEPLYVGATGRSIFQCGALTFGIAICHEGWRYPETVRWAARNGAHVVFHPHFELVEDENFRPAHFADPQNTFHEKAALCRAAENTVYFATVNCALPGATTTSAIIDPEGRLIAHHPYAEHGLLIGEIDTEKATGFLASRYRPE